MSDETTPENESAVESDFDAGWFERLQARAAEDTRPSNQATRPGARQDQRLAWRREMLTDEQRAERARQGADWWQKRRAAERDSSRGERIANAKGKLLSWLEVIGAQREHRECSVTESRIPGELKAWAAEFPAAVGSAVLIGDRGCGKTQATVWCLRQFFLRTIGEDPEWSFNGPKCRIITARRLFRLVFEHKAAELDQLASAALLAIDDLGAAYESEWPLAEMDGLIDDRWGERLPTIVTTNLMPSIESARRVGKPETSSMEYRYPRAYSRLRDKRGPGLVFMGSEDLRV